MSQSIQCTTCQFAFLRLIDAGDFHAYVCLGCGETQKLGTADRLPGNRPVDVCALCDRAIVDKDYHIFCGPGIVHGGGREESFFHSSCLQFACGVYGGKIRKPDMNTVMAGTQMQRIADRERQHQNGYLSAPLA